MWVKGSKAFGHPPWLSKALVRELEGEWDSWGMNQHLYGIMALERGGLACEAIVPDPNS